MEGEVAVLAFFAITGFSIAIFALFVAIAWAKDLDERLKKLEKKWKQKKKF